MVLTLTMVLSLAACGNDDANPDQATDSTQVQTGDTTDNNQTGDTQSSDVDLAALRTQILTDCGITDSVNVETDALNNLYGITADQVASSASFNATSGETAASYDPTSLELAEDCPVVTNGVYVGMFFSSHYDDMVAAFQNALA